MTSDVYTLGVWRVREGREEAFIRRWKDLGEAFAALRDPPGKGTLLRSASDPTLFYSFGPWSSMEAIQAMREDDGAKAGLGRLIELCTEATPGAFHVVAEAP